MISTKGRYALRVMLDLAAQDPDKYIPLDEIATRQDISKKYLEIVLKTLVSEKLLKGVRGKGGGYKLTRTPGEYSIGEILELSEGKLAPVACLSDCNDPCPRRDNCITLPMWKRYYELTHDFFYGITLEDLLNEFMENSEISMIDSSL
ncbi:MAG: Rrf2 family transcriptional regulator [Lachnospiraceae bacterium]|nr:Rrf2 family transcriptional regulator [Lachnospiraceae bacterium]